MSGYVNVMEAGQGVQLKMHELYIYQGMNSKNMAMRHCPWEGRLFFFNFSSEVLPYV
jgi:hypothetical protein